MRRAVFALREVSSCAGWRRGGRDATLLDECETRSWSTKRNILVDMFSKSTKK